MARPNWSRTLPRPLKIPTVMTLATLADIRELVERHLPAECRERETWQHVAAQLNAAARGGDIDEAVARCDWCCSSSVCLACRSEWCRSHRRKTARPMSAMTPSKAAVSTRLSAATVRALCSRL